MCAEKPAGARDGTEAFALGGFTETLPAALSRIAAPATAPCVLRGADPLSLLAASKYGSARLRTHWAGAPVSHGRMQRNEIEI
jgi:hypothetical protein